MFEFQGGPKDGENPQTVYYPNVVMFLNDSFDGYHVYVNDTKKVRSLAYQGVVPCELVSQVHAPHGRYQNGESREVPIYDPDAVFSEFIVGNWQEDKHVRQT